MICFNRISKFSRLYTEGVLHKHNYVALSRSDKVFATIPLAQCLSVQHSGKDIGLHGIAKQKDVSAQERRSRYATVSALCNNMDPVPVPQELLVVRSHLSHRKCWQTLHNRNCTRPSLFWRVWLAVRLATSV